MAFPVSPTNGQTAVVNNITYQFSNVGNTWTRILSTANVITANTIVSNGLISAVGNVVGNYILGNLACASGIYTSRIFNGTSEANIGTSGGNANITIGGTSNVVVVATTGTYVNGLVSASGNVTGNYFLGNVACASGIYASRIFNGNSEANISTSGGNANISIGGTSNVAVFATTGEYVTGVVSASGNVTGGNLLTGGLISATSTITSAANITGGNLTTSGLISATGNITGGNANITSTTASTSKTTGALIVAGGLGVAGTVYNNRLVSQGAYGNIILNEFTAIYNQKDSGTALIQTTTNALSAGIGVQVTGAPGNGSQIYSTGTMDIKVGVVTRAEDTPTGGTTIASVASTGLTVTGLVSATGNVTGGNILTAGQISATGNITGNFYIGNGAFLTGLSAGSSNGISNGATSISIPVSSGNIAMSVAGQSNTVVINLGSFTMYGTFAGPKTLNANVSVANAVNALLLGPVVIGNAYNITVPDASTLYVYAP